MTAINTLTPVDFFTVSKFLEPLLNPGNLLAVILIIAMVVAVIRNLRSGGWIAGGCAGLLLIVLIFPLGAWSLAPLENRFPHPAWPDRADGALILGGGESSAAFAVRGAAAMIESEGRYAAAIEAMRRYPNLRVVFSAGQDVDAARAALEQLGADMRRITFEKHARNSWENFLFSKPVARPRPGETWLLITHASQIPRAMGIARKLNWRFLPWPVDYRTGLAPTFGLQFSDNLFNLDIATHEWEGLVAYWATGRSTALFPAPEGANSAPAQPGRAG